MLPKPWATPAIPTARRWNSRPVRACASSVVGEPFCGRAGRGASYVLPRKSRTRPIRTQNSKPDIRLANEAGFYHLPETAREIDG
jgi:hypothetical protein